jgi:hypothetical protein
LNTNKSPAEKDVVQGPRDELVFFEADVKVI